MTPAIITVTDAVNLPFYSRHYTGTLEDAISRHAKHYRLFPPPTTVYRWGKVWVIPVPEELFNVNTPKVLLKE